MAENPNWDITRVYTKALFFNVFNSDLFLFIALISGQCSHFAPPENNRKPLFSIVFRRYKMGTFTGNGLIMPLFKIYLVTTFSTKPSFTYSKYSIETLEQGVKYVQS